MNNDQIMGWTILLASILGVIAYFYLTFLSAWMMLTIKISAFIAVAAILLIIAGSATQWPQHPHQHLSRILTSLKKGKKHS